MNTSVPGPASTLIMEPEGCGQCQRDTSTPGGGGGCEGWASEHQPQQQSGRARNKRPPTKAGKIFRKILKAFKPDHGSRATQQQQQQQQHLQQPQLARHDSTHDGPAACRPVASAHSSTGSELQSGSLSRQGSQAPAADPPLNIQPSYAQHVPSTATQLGANTQRPSLEESNVVTEVVSDWDIVGGGDGSQEGQPQLTLANNTVTQPNVQVGEAPPGPQDDARADRMDRLARHSALAMPESWGSDDPPPQASKQQQQVHQELQGQGDRARSMPVGSWFAWAEHSSPAAVGVHASQQLAGAPPAKLADAAALWEPVRVDVAASPLPGSSNSSGSSSAAVEPPQQGVIVGLPQPVCSSSTVARSAVSSASRVVASHESQRDLTRRIALIQEQVAKLTDEELLDPRTTSRVQLMSPGANSGPFHVATALDTGSSAEAMRTDSFSHSVPAAAHDSSMQPGAQAGAVSPGRAATEGGFLHALSSGIIDNPQQRTASSSGVTREGSRAQRMGPLPMFPTALSVSTAGEAVPITQPGILSARDRMLAHLKQHTPELHSQDTTGEQEVLTFHSLAQQPGLVTLPTEAGSSTAGAAAAGHASAAGGGGGGMFHQQLGLSPQATYRTSDTGQGFEFLLSSSSKSSLHLHGMSPLPSPASTAIGANPPPPGFGSSSVAEQLVGTHGQAHGHGVHAAWVGPALAAQHPATPNMRGAASSPLNPPGIAVSPSASSPHLKYHIQPSGCLPLGALSQQPGSSTHTQGLSRDGHAAGGGGAVGTAAVPAASAGPLESASEHWPQEQQQRARILHGSSDPSALLRTTLSGGIMSAESTGRAGPTSSSVLWPTTSVSAGLGSSQAVMTGVTSITSSSGTGWAATSSVTAAKPPALSSSGVPAAPTSPRGGANKFSVAAALSQFARTGATSGPIQAAGTDAGHRQGPAYLHSSATPGLSVQQALQQQGNSGLHTGAGSTVPAGWPATKPAQAAHSHSLAGMPQTPGPATVDHAGAGVVQLAGPPLQVHPAASLHHAAERPGAPDPRMSGWPAPAAMQRGAPPPSSATAAAPSQQAPAGTSPRSQQHQATFSTACDTSAGAVPTARVPATRAVAPQQQTPVPTPLLQEAAAIHPGKGQRLPVQQQLHHCSTIPYAQRSSGQSLDLAVLGNGGILLMQSLHSTTSAGSLSAPSPTLTPGHAAAAMLPAPHQQGLAPAAPDAGVCTATKALPERQGPVAAPSQAATQQQQSGVLMAQHHLLQDCRIHKVCVSRDSSATSLAPCNSTPTAGQVRYTSSEVLYGHLYGVSQGQPRSSAAGAAASAAALSAAAVTHPPPPAPAGDGFEGAPMQADSPCSPRPPMSPLSSPGMPQQASVSLVGPCKPLAELAELPRKQRVRKGVLISGGSMGGAASEEGHHHHYHHHRSSSSSSGNSSSSKRADGMQRWRAARVRRCITSDILRVQALRMNGLKQLSRTLSGAPPPHHQRSSSDGSDCATSPASAAKDLHGGSSHNAAGTADAVAALAAVAGAADGSLQQQEQEMLRRLFAGYSSPSVEEEDGAWVLNRKGGPQDGNSSSSSPEAGAAMPPAFEPSSPPAPAVAAGMLPASAMTKPSRELLHPEQQQQQQGQEAQAFRAVKRAARTLGLLQPGSSNGSFVDDDSDLLCARIARVASLPVPLPTPHVHVAADMRPAMQARLQQLQALLQLGSFRAGASYSSSASSTGGHVPSVLQETASTISSSTQSLAGHLMSGSCMVHSPTLPTQHPAASVKPAIGRLCKGAAQQHLQQVQRMVSSIPEDAAAAAADQALPHHAPGLGFGHDAAPPPGAPAAAMHGDLHHVLKALAALGFDARSGLAVNRVRAALAQLPMSDMHPEPELYGMADEAHNMTNTTAVIGTAAASMSPPHAALAGWAPGHSAAAHVPSKVAVSSHGLLGAAAAAGEGPHADGHARGVEGDLVNAVGEAAQQAAGERVPHMVLGGPSDAHAPVAVLQTTASSAAAGLPSAQLAARSDEVGQVFGPGPVQAQALPVSLSQPHEWLLGDQQLPQQQQVQQMQDDVLGCKHRSMAAGQGVFGAPPMAPMVLQWEAAVASGHGATQGLRHRAAAAAGNMVRLPSSGMLTTAADGLAVGGSGEWRGYTSSITTEPAGPWGHGAGLSASSLPPYDGPAGWLQDHGSEGFGLSPWAPQVLHPPPQQQQQAVASQQAWAGAAMWAVGHTASEWVVLLVGGVIVVLNVLCMMFALQTMRELAMHR